MDSIVTHLVKQFDSGNLTRRELLHGLAMLTAVAQNASAAGLKGVNINHVSILVSDLAKSTDFYGRIFGLTVVNEDKAHQIVRLGNGRTLVSIRLEPPAGQVDHFAIGIDHFDKQTVTRELQQLGQTPRENLEFGFHIKDPDGVNVQITDTGTA